MKKIPDFLKNRRTLKGFVVIGVFLLVLVFVNIAKSNHFPNVFGYAWGADDWTDLDGDHIQDAGETMNPPGGLGFVSFNCASGGNCSSSDYGVNIDAEGNMAGHAWSPHFGWLQFGGLSGFPIGPGTVSQNANIIAPGTSGCAGPEQCVVGWARFCAGADSNATCSGGNGEGTDKGSWDGWVSLKGTGYGVTLDATTGEFDGYAWGGNHDLYGYNSTGTGWIDFKTDVAGVIYDPLGDPAILLTADPQIVDLGDPTTLTWSGTEDLVPGEVCTASGGISDPDDNWASPPLRISPDGTFTTGPLQELGTHPYTITCPVQGPGNLTVESTVNVTVGIDLRLEADPSVAPWPDYETDLRWFVIPSNTTFASCSATSSPNVPEWNGAKQVPPFIQQGVNVPANPTTFSLSCTTPGGTVVNAVPVSVPRGPIPQADIVLSHNGASPNGSGQFTTTITWSTQGIVSGTCDAYTELPSSGTGWTWQNGDDFGVQAGVLVPNIPPAPKTKYWLACERLSGGIHAEFVELDTATGPSAPPRPHYKEN
jgi:hypothetical protein